MHNPEHTPQEPNDPFDDIVGELDITPEVSYESQKELFEAITRRHEAARQEADITRVAVDRLPLEAVGSSVNISLSRLLIRPGTERLSLRVYYSVPSPYSTAPVARNSFLEVGERTNGTITELETFTPEQAHLVFSQADELTGLQAEGYLPDLYPDLGSIFNKNTALGFPGQPHNKAT